MYALPCKANSPILRTVNQHGADLLEAVIAALQARKRRLRDLAGVSGIPYDTVLRIKNREGDPGYGKVRSLAQALGITAQVIGADGATTTPQGTNTQEAHDAA